MIAWLIARLIARGLGGIYLSLKKFFEKMKQDTRVWVYILILNVHFLHKNNTCVAASTYYGFKGRMYHR